jgi:hypothetical protein
VSHGLFLRDCVGHSISGGLIRGLFNHRTNEREGQNLKGRTSQSQSTLRPTGHPNTPVGRVLMDIAAPTQRLLGLRFRQSRFCISIALAIQQVICNHPPLRAVTGAATARLQSTNRFEPSRFVPRVTTGFIRATNTINAEFLTTQA